MNKLIFRKKLPERNSIENIFNELLLYFDKLDVTKIELPEARASLSAVLANINYMRRNQGHVNHVTGDVNYIVPFVKNPILTFHDIGSALNNSLLKNILIKWCWIYLPAFFAKRITVISEASKQEVLKVIPFARKKISVIHNPVLPCFEFTPYEFNQNKPVIFLLGTKQNKNLERVIEALSIFNCHLLILGKLTVFQQELLSKFEYQFGLADSEFRSYENPFNVSMSEVVDMYKRCDIVGFVSLYEGFGMPVIEGQAVGRPVVGGDIPSIREVAEDSVALVNPKDLEGIRNMFKKIIEDQAYREDLIQKGNKNIERFSIAAIANEYVKIYKSVLDAAG